ncbi:hypothetical protein [Fundidesulfovibrio terrae]|uniref:hypothetical protein n=1 Tax=Fundidesulfovibrio terrae TaxID=2922866 RepID=UPI001FAF22E9|nr:hypothetical protein [Fundidesulfovibrio terrae]
MKVIIKMRSVGNKSIEYQWRKLGFFYDVDEEQKQWIFVGSKSGLLKLHAILNEYSRSKQYRKISSHEHYGPYLYLKIMTWESPGVDRDSIHGSQADIGRLADIVLNRLNGSAPGDIFVVKDEYAQESDYCIAFAVKGGGFDPATVDMKSFMNK